MNAPGCTEQVAAFECQGETLIGIVSRPDSARRVGVVIVVGGPQYRAGSHRQFVLLARALAQGGYAAIRFDYRGMGDSSGELRTFEAIEPDIAAAIGALRTAAPEVDRVVLWGLCDGASAALMYVLGTRDPVVAGLCLANPWLRSEAGQARAQVKHYYLQRLKERAFWVKLLSGKVAVAAISGLATSIRLALSGPGPDQALTLSYQHRMAQAWRVFEGPMLLLLSGQDLTAREFADTVAREPQWLDALQRSRLHRVDMPKADHTFSGDDQRREAEKATLQWLDALKAP